MSKVIFVAVNSSSSVRCAVLSSVFTCRGVFTPYCSQLCQTQYRFLVLFEPVIAVITSQCFKNIIESRTISIDYRAIVNNIGEYQYLIGKKMSGGSRFYSDIYNHSIGCMNSI